MSRKKKSQAKQTHRATRSSAEERSSVALTVAWMLTSLATAIALAVVVVGQMLVWQFPPETSGSAPFAFVPSLFLLMATITGLVCLTLTPVVYRVRRDPPPRSIATAAVVVSLIPFAIIAWRTLFA